jgi:hypothetical protein
LICRCAVRNRPRPMEGISNWRGRSVPRKSARDRAVDLLAEAAS